MWNFDWKNYEFAKAVLKIDQLIDSVIHTYGVEAVFIEDIYMKGNPMSFKNLARLQGVLVNQFEKNEYLYGIVAPSSWQAFCGARGRTEKEKKAGITQLQPPGKKKTKILSIEAARELYGVETENDNLADAIMIGHYVVNNIKIGRKDNSDEKN